MQRSYKWCYGDWLRTSGGTYFRKGKRMKGIWLPVLICACLIAMIQGLIMLDIHQTEKRRRVAYIAWTKLTHNTETITYEEWKALVACGVQLGSNDNTLMHVLIGMERNRAIESALRD